MEIVQCPECELRFLYPYELDQHLRADHPEFHAETRQTEDSVVAAAHRLRHRHRHHVPHTEP